MKGIWPVKDPALLITEASEAFEDPA